MGDNVHQRLHKAQRTTAKHNSHTLYFVFAKALYLQFCGCGMIKYSYLCCKMRNRVKQIKMIIWVKQMKLDDLVVIYHVQTTRLLHLYMYILCTVCTLYEIILNTWTFNKLLNKINQWHQCHYFLFFYMTRFFKNVTFLLTVCCA